MSRTAALAVGDPDAVVGGVDDGPELAVEVLDDTQLVGDLLDAREILEDADGTYDPAFADDGRIVDHEGHPFPRELLPRQEFARFHDVHEPRVGNDVEDVAAQGFNRPDAEQILRHAIGHDDGAVLIDGDDPAFGRIHDRGDLLAEFRDACLQRIRIALQGNDTGKFIVLVKDDGRDVGSGNAGDLFIESQAG